MEAIGNAGGQYFSDRRARDQNQGKTEPVKERNEDGGYSSVRVKKSSLPALQRLISMYHVKTGTQTNLAGIVEALIELGMREWK